MKLKLKNTSGESVTLIIKPEDTFIDLRERVAEELGLRLDLSDIVNGEHYLETQRVLDFFSQLPHGDETYVDNDVTNVECIVAGCNKTKSTHPEYSFFEFPTEEIRNHQWALYCQRLTGESGKKRLNITSASRICSDHFKPEQFVKNAGTILKRTAVPCINPEVNARFLSSSGGGLPSPNQLPDNLHSHTFFDQISPDSSDPTSLILTRKDKKPLCRLCGKYTDNSIFLFDESIQPLSLADKINCSLPINVDMCGPLPKQICTQCFLNLEKVFRFSETAVMAHLDLKQRTNNHLNRSGVIASSEGTDDSPSLSLCCDFSDELETKETGTECRMCLSGQMSTTSLSFPDKCLSDERDWMCKREDSLCKDPTTIKPVDIMNKTLLKDQVMDKEGSVETKKHGGQQNINDNWEAADNAFTYSCMQCSADFKSYADLLPHSLMHSEDGNYVCCLCNFVCSRKYALTDHFKTHETEPSNTVYQCDNCGIGVRSLTLFEIHNCTSINCSLNKCDICHKTFRSESRLEFHMKFHENGDKPGRCELCPKTFSDEIKLYKHVTYLHGQGKDNKNHCCEECGKVFRSLSSLKYHLRVHQGEPYSLRPFSCDICGKCFSRRSMLRNHLAIFHKSLSLENESFMCSVCFELFPCRDTVSIHIERIHPLHGDVNYQTLTSSVYTCEFCKRCFASSTHLNNHRSKHRNESPYECKHCLAEFTLSRELEAHNLNHSNINTLAREYLLGFSVPVLYLCEYCDRSFVSSFKYTEHLTIHYGPTPYLCGSCDDKFESLDDVYSHRISHHTHTKTTHNETNYYRPFDCHYCNKSFAIEDALIKHIRMHTGEKPFICDQCGKGFSQSSGLYTHQKVHSTDRPYSCTICPRKFKIKGDRDIHVRKHSGERPYKCEFCGKAFMTQHVYSQHRKIHTGERPYKCDVCHISFRRSHVLTVHKRIHTGEKPNMCDICGKSYRQKGDMLKHKRIQHGYSSVKPNNTVSLFDQPHI